MIIFLILQKNNEFYTCRSFLEGSAWLRGMAFPLGIRLLEQDGPSMIPWVWGVNGACSVMGSIIAWGLSLNFGYTITLLAATAVYGCAYLVMVRKPRLLQQ